MLIHKIDSVQNIVIFGQFFYLIIFLLQQIFLLRAN